jgi:hypothetical protein
MVNEFAERHSTRNARIQHRDRCQRDRRAWDSQGEGAKVGMVDGEKGGARVEEQKGSSDEFSDSLLVRVSDGIAVHSEVRPETKVMELRS